MPDPEIGHVLEDSDRELLRYPQALIADRADDAGRHTVGAAVRDVRGRIYGGVNLAHFTGGPCAEPVALATARTQGAAELTLIVAVRRNGEVLGPCGRDRQVLFDYHPDIWVVIPADAEPLKVHVNTLLPFGARWTPAGGTE